MDKEEKVRLRICVGRGRGDVLFATPDGSIPQTARKQLFGPHHLSGVVPLPLLRPLAPAALDLELRDRVVEPCNVAPLQGLIHKATENNESPAPGWALDQMARLTVQKPGIELEMVELLYKRLLKNACDVKLKTLRAMHFIARRGSVAFRRAMQRSSQVMWLRRHLSTRPSAFSAGPLAALRAHRPLHPTDSRRALLYSHPGQPAPGARRCPLALDP